MRQAELFTDIVLSDQKRKVRVAYYDSKIGSKTLLLVHGFTSFSYTWEKMSTFISPEYRIIWGEVDYHEKISWNEKVEVFVGFLKYLQIKELSIAAHSFNCPLVVEALSSLREFCKIEKLIFLNPIIGSYDVPEFFEILSKYNGNNPLVKFANEDICAYIILKEIFGEEKHIYSDMTNAYADYLRDKGRREYLIQQAKTVISLNHKNIFKALDNINIPALIICGEADKIGSLASGRKLYKLLENSEFKTFDHCGHSPQEEYPERTAHAINKFLRKSFAEEKSEANLSNSELHSVADGLSKQQLHMRNLIEKWSFGSMIILLFMKFIQLLKKLGLKANDNGWRKACGIFLQNEESKFILGSFNLKYYYEDTNIPSTFDDAKTLFINRISDFLQQKSGLHWTMEPKLLTLKRKKLDFTDIIETTFNEAGDLIKLTPYFDPTRQSFDNLHQKELNLFLEHFIDYYNRLKRREVNNIARKMTSHLRRWCLRRRALSFNARLDLKQLIDRVLSATFITFELAPAKDNAKYMRRKFSPPNVKKYRHPGWGLLNMIVRFTPDFKNSDLWVQYHHVPVDGMPMQELLEELKQRWGYTEELLYPNLTNHDSSPEVYYSGGKIFRARMFVDFSKFLAVRKFLNENYQAEMNGPATTASMIIWGLSQHEVFRDAKVLFPIDIEKGVQYADERELSVFLIRPSKYFNNKDTLSGFFRYQREFNQRLADTRLGNSESYEMLELYSMVHPIFYYFAKMFFKESVSDYLGNVGLSMMKNAEMFISPISDLQKNGFLAFGNMSVPTVDGKKAGAVSICGSRHEIKAYIDAVASLAENYDKFLNINFNAGERKND